MKKISLILIAILVITFMSCSGAGGGDGSSSNESRFANYTFLTLRQFCKFDSVGHLEGDWLMRNSDFPNATYDLWYGLGEFRFYNTHGMEMDDLHPLNNYLDTNIFYEYDDQENAQNLQYSYSSHCGIGSLSHVRCIRILKNGNSIVVLQKYADLVFEGLVFQEGFLRCSIASNNIEILNPNATPGELEDLGWEVYKIQGKEAIFEITRIVL